MQKAIVQLTFRQVISAGARSDFEKMIFHFSYDEYKMKSQVYNPEGAISTFSKLKQKDGRANSLHYKTGFAVAGLIDNLKNIIPCLQDNIGQPVQFETYKFELIESDITDIKKHVIAIHYITGPLALLHVIGDSMLLTKEISFNATEQKPCDTFMLSIQNNFAITSYQEIAEMVTL